MRKRIDFSSQSIRSLAVTLLWRPFLLIRRIWKGYIMSKTVQCLTVLILISAVVANQGPPSPDKEAITRAVLAAHRDMNRAEKRLDVNAMFQHILDDESCSIIQDGRLFTSHQSAYNVIQQGFQRVAEVNRTFDTQEVTVLNARTALLVAKGQVRTVLTDGREFDSPFALSTLFVERDGRWQILHGHYSAPNPQ